MHKKFSKLGYILAMAGSAIGLGNAWKFPTMTGNHGGFAFIFLYFVLTILIACVAFLAVSLVPVSCVMSVKFSPIIAPPQHKHPIQVESVPWGVPVVVQ